MNELAPVTEHKLLPRIRQLIWLYFWLLIIEGALRKWVAPALSNPLLIIRDPVVIAIYIFAIRARIFPRNGWMTALWIVGLLSLALSFVTLWPYLPPERIALVSGFGFRSNFVHLPLLFVMQKALRVDDVKKFGWWTLLVLIPMTALMVLQFRASPDAFVNRTAGGEGESMLAALGKVRTSATFSFVIGVVSYFSIATAFLIWGALKRAYPNWLLVSSAIALVIGIAVSGSRSVVGACAVVVASLGVVLILRPSAVNRVGQILLATVVLGWAISKAPVFKEGVDVLTTRFTDVAEATEQSVAKDVFTRSLSSFTDGLYVLTKAPFLGYGLGVGTNAGAKFLVGRSTFLLSEGEWSRIFLESGPLLGLAYVIWRCALIFPIGAFCLRAVRRGEILPLLLFSTAFLALLSGQFGQPTVLGFAVFGTGLALAAFNERPIRGVADLGSPGGDRSPGRPMARLSPYASRLHRPPHVPEDHRNGSADR
ncbi:MAG: hypothetical protein M3Y69_04080 [Verrucomicrobiota bacterium]|nr:hypothetical protein [Verrucomicrobiota bacterium]